MAERDDARQFLELLLARAKSHADRVKVLKKGLELGIPLHEIEELLDRDEATRSRDGSEESPTADDERPEEPPPDQAGK